MKGFNLIYITMLQLIKSCKNKKGRKMLSLKSAMYDS